jgi:hypothetical protein
MAIAVCQEVREWRIVLRVSLCNERWGRTWCVPSPLLTPAIWLVPLQFAQADEVERCFLHAVQSQQIVELVVQEGADGAGPQSH